MEMYKILYNHFSPPFIADMMTEICVPHNALSTSKAEEDESGNFQRTKKNIHEIPAIIGAS